MKVWLKVPLSASTVQGDDGVRTRMSERSLILDEIEVEREQFDGCLSPGSSFFD